MDFTLYLLIGIPIIVFLCVITSIYCFCKYGIESRYQSHLLGGALRYINETIIIPQENIERPRNFTKREKRKIRLHQFLVSHKEQQVEEQIAQKYDEKQTNREAEEQQQGQTLLDNLIRSLKLLSPYSTKNKSQRTSSALSPSKIRPSSPSFNMFSWFSSKKDTNESSRPEGSTKSKRFISQDRLQRAEARKLLLRTKSAKIYDSEEVMEEKTENVISLLDIEENIQSKQQQMIEARKLRHQLQKQQLKQQNPNYIDRIAINSGPLPHQIPKGYKVIHFIADIEPATVLYKRILYLWEGKHLKVQGWFIGTIGGVSKQPNCNYQIKYDRAETGSLFVDGFRSVQLSLSGEEAYGKRWVLIEKIEPKKDYLRNRSRSP